MILRNFLLFSFNHISYLSFFFLGSTVPIILDDHLMQQNIVLHSNIIDVDNQSYIIQTNGKKQVYNLFRGIHLKLRHSLNLPLILNSLLRYLCFTPIRSIMDLVFSFFVFFFLGTYSLVYYSTNLISLPPPTCPTS